MKLAIGIQYDGTRYHGWQAQKGLSATIQTQVEKALSKVANHPIQLICAGRTDAGVHAVEQVAHFETQVVRSNYGWMMGANRYLPKDITLYWVTPVSREFHARFSATARYYRYILCAQSIRLTLFRHQVGWCYSDLNCNAMEKAIQFFLGEHDFQNFRNKDCQAKTSIRTIQHINLVKKGTYIIIDIKANAFLHHMVRNIVGALIEVGKGKQKIQWINILLDNPYEKLKNGICTAPPQGLYFIKAFYPEIFQLPQQPLPIEWMDVLS